MLYFENAMICINNEMIDKRCALKGVRVFLKKKNYHLYYLLFIISLSVSLKNKIIYSFMKSSVFLSIVNNEFNSNKQIISNYENTHSIDYMIEEAQQEQQKRQQYERD